MLKVKNIKKYAVWISSTATEAEQYAVKELTDFIYESVGVRLPIKEEAKAPYIAVGKMLPRCKELAAGLKDGVDGFVLKTENGNLFIGGKTDRGVLYGVYDFLERALGVRFFAPSETYVPKYKKFSMPELDVLSEPDFRMRTYLTYPVYQMNPDMTFVTRTRTLHNWFQPSAKYGGPTNTYSRWDGAHNARMFVPAEKYGTPESTGYKGPFAPDHDPHPEFYISVTPPEYFGQISWNRGTYLTIDWTNGVTADGKLDETMGLSVAKIVVEEMKKDVLANPQAEYFLFTQEDCIDPVTDKALLEKYKASGVVIRFCNVIARELQKWSNKELGGRKINIVTFAYNQTQDPPVYFDEAQGKYMPIDETVVPEENVCVYLAEGCFPYCAYDDPRQTEEAKTTHLKWQSICKNFWFWGYDAIYTDFFTYNPSFGLIDGTLKMLKEMNVDFVMLEASHNCINDWQSYMKHYVWTKKLWDITLDTEALKEEYIDRYYGAGADGVRQMMKLYDEYYAEILRKNPQLFLELGPYKEIGTAEYLTPELMEQAIAIISKAEARVNVEEKDERRKEKLLSRLAGVKLTPTWMKLKHFETLYPDVENARKKKYALGVEVLNLSLRAGVNVRSEKGSIFEYLYSELCIG